jgi:cytoskeleton protein RodZ
LFAPLASDVPRRQSFPPPEPHLEGTPDIGARPDGGGVSTPPPTSAPGANAVPAGAPVTPLGPKRNLLRPPPWDKSVDAELGSSFGAWLRRQREAREISLREVAERTKISLRYLEAMEEDRFEVLPAPVFAKGFLREYARYVGLNPDEVVNHYLSVQQPAAAEGADDEARRDRRGVAPQHGSHAALRPASTYSSTYARRWPRWLAVAAGVAVLLGLVALLAFLSDRWRQGRARRGEDRPPIVAPLAAPVPAAPPVPAAAPSAPLEVTVEFNQECWVEAVVDGGSRRAEMREAGESLQLEARQKVVFAKLGNAAAVEIMVNGYPYPLDRKPGEVVHDLAIDLDTVRSLAAKAKKEGH